MANPAALPFQEAIDFFKAKIKLPSSGWSDIWQEQHSHAFIVAGAAHDALIEDLYNAVAKAKDAGGYAVFQKEFGDIVARHGWAHNGTPGWRSKIIYDTNVTQAYNAGREKQMQAVKHLRPYAMYRHTSIEHPRLEHKAWNGLILPLDDPWWNTHTPQNGWGCKCRKYSLSRVEAEREWTKAGKAGPDEAPPIEMEERVIGKNGSNPRTVSVPKGIDPGFAYNPGKAWLEPHTVPPLRGYDAVVKERRAAWPVSDSKLPMPVPKKMSSALRVPGIDPDFAVAEFLDVFGATVEKGVVWTDVAGQPLAISRALFADGSGGVEWLAASDQSKRLENIYLLADTLADPDEVWWAWEKSKTETGRWELKRRYLKAFLIDETEEFGVVAFEWGKNGWASAAKFSAADKTTADRAEQFAKYRAGQRVFVKAD